MMERCASVLAFENLPDGHATVGFEVCIKHVGAAAEGALCAVTARLDEVADGRKLRFAVEVTEAERTIGVGTHERRWWTARPSAPDRPARPAPTIAR